MSPQNDDNNPWSKEAEDNQSKNRQSKIVGMAWKTGEHNIRILPAKEKGKLPFVKYIVHWVPVKTAKNDRPIIHAVDYRCPVCEYVSTLWSEIYRLKEEEEMTDKSPEVQKLLKLAGKLRGKKTYDMNVIHRNDYKTDDGKVKIKRLVAGPTIWKSILELGNSEKWGNPSAEGSRGYDLTVTVDGEGLKREYTILPDPERKPLTDEELKAVQESAYDLVKLRKFSTAKEIIDVLKVAKAPLDSLDLKAIKKSLFEDLGGENEGNQSSSTSDHEQESDDDSDDSHEDDVHQPVPKSPSSSKVDDDDDNEPNPAPVSSNADEDDDDDKEAKAVIAKDAEKEEKAFSQTPESSDDPSSGIYELDCRGTFDAEDIGCKECDYIKGCKQLKNYLKEKADVLGLDIEDLSGVEIEKLIKQKEKELSEKKEHSGKQGKQGKQGTSSAASSDAPVSTQKRKLPF